MTILEDIVNELYLGQSPYTFVDRSMRDEGYPHTNIVPSRIDQVLEAVQPRFWLELGAMTGGSAIRVAERIKAHKMNTQIICVDPFTGDVNMWDWEKKLTLNNEWRFLALKNGRPTIYDRFIANIVEAGHDDVIIPIQCTAMVGLKLLKRLKDTGRLSELPQVIYLDSAHELEETYVELKAAWDILPERGLLWGDDWSWGAVREDVSRFCAFIGMKPIVDEGHWLIWK